MSSLDLITGAARLLRERGPRDTYHEARAFIREAALRKYHSKTGRVEQGTPIYDQDWDLLVVLDACRVDFLREVAPEFDFLPEVNERTSVGSYSLSWMQRNFVEEYTDEMAETVHVTGNPFSETALDPNEFRRLEEVWRYSWDEDVGTIRPRALTDTAISLAREMDPNQMIVHYMQPHAPFTTAPELQRGPKATDWADATDKSIWMRVRQGEVSLDRARQAYREELRMVLNEVEVLLNNVDANVAIVTADHGEAMGESGIYGHARGVAIDSLRQVPWAPTTAEDRGTHNPIDHRGDASGVQGDRLRDLGYLE